MSLSRVAPHQNYQRGSRNASLTINGLPFFRGRNNRDVEDAGPSNSSPRTAWNDTFEQEFDLAESYENVTRSRHMTNSGASTQLQRSSEQRIQRPAAPLPRTEVTEALLRQLELCSDDNGSDVVTVRGSVNRELSENQSTQYGPAVVNGGIAIFGNVQRLTIYCQNGTVTGWEIPSNNTEERTQTSRQRVLGWLEEVLVSTGLRNSNVASSQHAMQEYDTDALSHEADRATSTAVTVVFVPEPQRPLTRIAPAPSLRLSRPTRFVAEKGRPKPDPADDPKAPDPNSPDPDIFNFGQSPFKPGDLLRASDMPVEQQLLIVLKSSPLASICFSISANQKAYPAASCVLLETDDGAMQLRLHGRQKALALVRVSMHDGSSLPSNSRVVPRLIRVIQHYGQLSKIGALDKVNMQKLVSAWRRESLGFIRRTHG